MRLRPMEGHEESAGADPIVEFERGASKAAPRNQAHRFASGKAQGVGIGRVNRDERSRTDLIQLGNVAGFGARVPMTAEASGVEDKRKSRR